MNRKFDRTMFLAITTKIDWAGIDDLVDACDEADFWSDEFLTNAVGDAKKACVSHLMKQLKDEEGMPLFHSVENTDPETGQISKVYMQEVLFNADDYRVVIHYHQDKASYHQDMAKKLDERCFRQYRISFLPGLDSTAA